MNRLAWAVLLALAACDTPTADNRPPVQPPPPTVAAPVLVPSDRGPRWSIDTPSGALAYGVGGDRPMVSLLCSEARAAFHVSVSGFRRIDSEDRLTLGAGDEAFAFAADLESTGPGVVADGTIPSDLLDRIERGESISAVYGAQSLNPIPGPPAAVTRPFITACRARLKPS